MGWCLGGGLVGRLGRGVVADDVAQCPAGVGGGAAVREVNPVGQVAVLVIAFPDRALVEVGVIRGAAAGEGDVGQVAGGGIGEHGVGGFGGDALGGVHGDRVPELHMLA